MVTRHLVRGFKDCIYYAERRENVEKIYQISLKGSSNDEIIKIEVHQIVGARIVAM